MDAERAARIDRVEREDIAAFLDACAACTGQAEYHAERGAQAVSIEFLHRYVLGNYRRLYARTLAAGINHFSRVQVVFELLRAGAPPDPAERAEEAALIEATLAGLPPQRVYRLFRRLARARINNRRTRATIRRYLARRDAGFDALKYRPGLRAAARHAHAAGLGEAGDFAFARDRERARWSHPLLDTWRRAHFSKAALFDLPMTVAEGLAAKHGIARKAFLEGIAAQMTAAERLRSVRSAERAGARLDEADLARMAPTRLALYLLSMPAAERAAHRPAWRAACAREVARWPDLELPARLAVIVDRSRSSSGSREKARRPLAVALAVAGLLATLAERIGAALDLRWTAAIDGTHGMSGAHSNHDSHGIHPIDALLDLDPFGQTDLATPLLAALAGRPELVVIVSDGFENDGPGAADEVARVARARLGLAPAIVHLNPVFDADTYRPRPLGPHIATLGVRDGEDLPLALTVGRFVHGARSMADLERLLGERAAALIARRRSAP